MRAKPLAGTGQCRPARSVDRHGYLFLPGGAVGFPGVVVGLPGGAVGLLLALAVGVADAGGVAVGVGGATVGGDAGVGGMGDDRVGLGPLLGWPGNVITASAVLRSEGEDGAPEGRSPAVGGAEGRTVVNDGKGPLHKAGVPKEPATTAIPTAARNNTSIELPDHAVVRARRNLRPESSTNTGDFVGPSLGVGRTEPVRLPSHITHHW